MLNQVVNFLTQELSFTGFGYNIKTLFFLTPLTLAMIKFSSLEKIKARIDLDFASFSSWIIALCLVIALVYMELLVGRAYIYFYESSGLYKNVFLVFFVLYNLWNIISESSAYQLWQVSNQELISLVSGFAFIAGAVLVYILYTLSPKGVWLIAKSILVGGVSYFILSFLGLRIR